MHKIIVKLGVTILICILASGCAVCSETTSHERGKKIDNSTLQQLEPGKTTQEWAISALGTPSSRNKLDNGTEVLKYEYAKTENQNLAIFLLLASTNEKKSSQAVCLEFRDNILIRYWTEED